MPSIPSYHVPSGWAPTAAAKSMYLTPLSSRIHLFLPSLSLEGTDGIVPRTGVIPKSLHISMKAVVLASQSLLGVLALLSALSFIPILRTAYLGLPKHNAFWKAIFINAPYAPV